MAVHFNESKEDRYERKREGSPRQNRVNSEFHAPPPRYRNLAKERQ